MSMARAMTSPASPIVKVEPEPASATPIKKSVDVLKLQPDKQT